MNTKFFIVFYFILIGGDTSHVICRKLIWLVDSKHRGGTKRDEKGWLVSTFY